MASKKQEQDAAPTVIPGTAWRPGKVGVLPVLMGYMVDERLREFRRMQRDVGIEVVPFDSDRGKALLAAYRREDG